MKKLTLLCAALLIAGVAVAETDYLASDWVDALKEGRTYNTRGKTGLLVTPRVSGTLYVDTIAEQTSGSGVTLDGVTLKDGATVANTISEKTAGNGVAVDGVKLKDGSYLIWSNNQEIYGQYPAALVVHMPTARASGGVTNAAQFLLISTDTNIVDGWVSDIAGLQARDSDGNTNAYAWIRITIDDQTEGTEDASWSFPTKIDGSNVEQFKITAAGIETPGSVATDTIVEKTAGNGVVADSVTLKDGGVQTSILPITTYGIGAVPAAVTGTVTVTEYGDGINHRTLLRAVDMPIVMAEGGTGTNGVGSTKIYDFPEGVIELEGCSVANYAITVDTNALDNADGGDWSFGTAAAGGASGLASTEVDFIASTGVDPITNVVFAYTATDAAWDGSTTAKDLYANQEVDDGDIAAACTNLVSFDMTIDWRNLGDD